jgi:hypothetical protein
VYVIAEEMNTGVGDALIETARSASPVVSTNTEVVVALFVGTGSVVCEVTSAEFTIVVPAAGALPPEFTVTTNVNAVVVVPLARAAPSVQVIWPVAPTAGEVHVHPVGGVIDENVVLGGVC